jgi:hypothetical protein
MLTGISFTRLHRSVENINCCSRRTSIVPILLAYWSSRRNDNCDDGKRRQIGAASSRSHIACCGAAGRFSRERNNNPKSYKNGPPFCDHLPPQWRLVGEGEATRSRSFFQCRRIVDLRNRYHTTIATRCKSEKVTISKTTDHAHIIYTYICTIYDLYLYERCKSCAVRIVVFSDWLDVSRLLCSRKN